MRRPRTRVCLLASLAPILAIAGAGCGGEGAEPDAGLFGIRNAARPEPGLVTGGQPTREQLEGLARAGYGTVIDLRTPGEDRGFAEREAAEELGLAYVNVPVDGADLGPPAFRRFFEALDGAQRPVLVHCASGNRVGALYYAYLAGKRGVPREEARDRGIGAGLRSAQLTGAVEAFLDAGGS